MNEQRIPTGTRIGSMLIDHITMCVIMAIIIVPIMIMQFSHAFTATHEQMDSSTYTLTYYLMVFALSLYTNKDCIGGRSVAKRVTRLQIVSNTTGLTASPIQCLVRNLFVIIWPIEVIAAMVNPARRIGDRVAGTKVVLFENAIIQPKVKLGQTIIAIVIGYGAMLLICLPFHFMQSKFSEPNVNYVVSSYNEQESKETEKLFEDSLGNSMTTDIRVYDTVRVEKIKYVSIIVQFRDNYFDNEHEYDHMKLKVENLLFTKYPKNSFVGQVKYIYKSPGHMESRWGTIDYRQADKKANQ